MGGEQLELELVLGSDSQNTYGDFLKMFPDDAACAAFLVRLRWTKGFACPVCQVASTPWMASRKESCSRLLCLNCHHPTSMTAGTSFDKTRTPLKTWFEVAWHLTTAKNGMAAKTAERTLGISYRVAWAMLQRFRVAMVNTGRNHYQAVWRLTKLWLVA